MKNINKIANESLKKIKYPSQAGDRTTRLLGITLVL